MNKMFVLLISVSLAAFFGIACQQTDRTAEDQVKSDAEITEDVKARFTGDPAIASADIEVDTEDGKVTLDGKVLGQSEAERAMELARSVEGVKTVESNLTVDTHITDEDVRERVEEGEEAAEARNEADQNQDDPNLLDDAAITAKVKMKLAEDEQVSAFQIDVDTQNQVVTLTGDVETEAAANQAIQLARSVEGVKDVRSVLQIQPEENE